MREIDFFGVTIVPWVYAPVFYFVWVSVWLMVKRVAFLYLSKRVTRSKTRIDDLLMRSLDLPLGLLIFGSGVVVLEQIAHIEADGVLTRYFLAALRITTVVAIAIFLDRLARGLIQMYQDRVEILKQTGGFAHGLVRVLVIGLGVLIILDSAGVSITPIIASLGIGSLAVALALQPTLENLFAGAQIVIDRSVQPGQFVKLASGEEGYVQRVGWRSTWIRQLPGSMVVIPNKELVNLRLINYYYPSTELAALVQVGVHYDSDLDKVERVTVEVAKEVMQKVAGGVPHFEPFIRYHTFDSSSINFTVILRAREFVDQFLVKHEFIKRLHERYKQEGVVIPYPIRALNLTQEKAELKMGKD